LNNFFKYLTADPEDKNWGIYLTVAGYTKVLSGMDYPFGKHPSGYNFNWENGRILKEYQLVYITEGEGLFETRNQKFIIKPGMFFLIYPGIWHRYKPKLNKGWVELYIGIEGEIVRRLMSHPVLTKSPVVACGLQETLLDCFDRIIELVREDKPGFQLEASGYIVRLIGSLISKVRYLEFARKPSQNTVENIRFLIHQNADQKIDFKKVAASQNIGYSHFRKLFKKYTGLSPVNYHLKLKLLKSKELLLHSEKSLKEIAFETGFASESYFSRTFREKMGQAPSELRKLNKKVE
jgi:AraC-like DNA-binding protein